MRLNFRHLLTLLLGLFIFFAETSAFANTSAPVINIWYGPDQLFGNNGIPQAWVNILGNVSDNSGIAALSYRLNNGLQVSLSIGPDGKRLQSVGDFNIDMAYSTLSCGANTVDISATDTAGNVATETVNVFYYCNTYWPRTYSIDWGTVTNIQDVSQVVDGDWSLEGSAIRPVILGYDRLIAIGDIDPTWKDYEVTVPIILNSPLNSSVPYGPLFGIVMHWQGHYDWDGSQPRWGWYPLGAMGIYDWVPQDSDYRLRILGSAENSIAEDLSGRHLSVGVPYIFKMRAELVSNYSVYSLKVWEAGTPEPPGWNLRGQGISSGLNHGSLLLLSHYSDVSFGNVSVTPGPFFDDVTPPVINNITVATDASSARITWTTDELASGTIAYGLTDAYEKGSVKEIAMVTSRTITLTDLSAESTYHFRVTSEDAYNNSSGSADLTFTTTSDQSQIVSDDFSGSSLNTAIWKIINPGNDATISLVGTGTTDARLSINIPEGASHDVWSGNMAPGMIQAAANADFGVEVKFQSTFASQHQIQGVIVEQDNNNFIRFDFVRDNIGTRVFAATLSKGSPTVKSDVRIVNNNPLYLRVKRSGNQWTESYSYDGTNWTVASSFPHYITVASVGPFAGNAGNPAPAFTSAIDYFFNMKSPIVPEDYIVHNAGNGQDALDVQDSSYPEVDDDANGSTKHGDSEAENGADENVNDQADEGVPTTTSDRQLSVLRLVDPENGATDVPKTVTLKWESLSDSEGDSVTYILHIDTDPGLEDTTPIIVTVVSNNNLAVAMKYSLSIFGLFGIIAFGGLSKARRKTGFLIISIAIVICPIVTSCGSSGKENNRAIHISHTVNFLPNTTYYWKVVAEKNQESVAESDTFSFKTGQ